MRAPLLFMLLALPLLGCKKDEPAPTTTTTTSPTATSTVKRGEVEPVGCKGMDTAAKCKECCDPKYWNPSFVGGRCACVKKLSLGGHLQAHAPRGDPARRSIRSLGVAA